MAHKVKVLTFFGRKRKLNQPKNKSNRRVRFLNKGGAVSASVTQLKYPLCVCEF